MVLPPRLPGTRPRASARTACVPYTATLWREHRVQDREHYPVSRSGSLVFAGQASSAARARRGCDESSDPPAGQSGPCDRSGQTSLGGRLSGAWSRCPGPDARRTARAGSWRWREQRQRQNWPATTLVQSPICGFPARPSGVPVALRKHHIGRSDRSVGTETKSRYLLPVGKAGAAGWIIGCQKPPMGGIATHDHARRESCGA
jgi:hypothetical protein